MSAAPPPNVVLIGLRGCGKTSAGRIVAERLNWTFVDTDEHIERTAERSIREIFEGHGEPHFRHLETQAVERVARGRRQVIAVGGGAVLSEHNRQILRAGGVCVWLTAPPEELQRRLLADPRTPGLRPALTSQPPLEELHHLLRSRQALYAATAHHTIDTLGRSVAEVAERILQLLAPLGIESSG
jgi:shikimate kinase